jgi:hypothetical protein
LRFEVGGTSPHGYTVRKPGPAGLVTVTFMATPTASSGTPSSPAIGTTRVSAGGNAPPDGKAPALVPSNPFTSTTTVNHDNSFRTLVPPRSRLPAETVHDETYISGTT